MRINDILFLSKTSFNDNLLFVENAICRDRKID